MKCDMVKYFCVSSAALGIASCYSFCHQISTEKRLVKQTQVWGLKRDANVLINSSRYNSMLRIQKPV